MSEGPFQVRALTQHECCMEASVVDTRRPLLAPPVCECPAQADAELIAGALNAKLAAEAST